MDSRVRQRVNLWSLRRKKTTVQRFGHPTSPTRMLEARTNMGLVIQHHPPDYPIPHAPCQMGPRPPSSVSSAYPQRVSLFRVHPWPALASVQQSESPTRSCSWANGVQGRRCDSQAPRSEMQNVVEVEPGRPAADGRPSVGPTYRSAFARDGFPPPVPGMDSCYDIFRWALLSLARASPFGSNFRAAGAGLELAVALAGH